MANHYVKAAFAVSLMPAEALLIEQAFEAAQRLCEGIGPDEAAALHAGFGAAFAAAFPPGQDDPFAAVRALFDDPDYSGFGCDLDVDQPGPDGRVKAWFGGDQVSVDALPRLFCRAAPASLPIGFQFAFTCDRLRTDEFGGGYALATAEGPSWGDTRSLLERAFAQASGEGTDGFVLATRDREYGLSFWNAEDGFGRLATATVFSEAEAARYDVPIADDQPEWLALPAALGR